MMKILYTNSKPSLICLKQKKKKKTMKNFNKNMETTK